MTHADESIPSGPADLSGQMKHLQDQIQTLQDNLRLVDDLRARLGTLSERMVMMTQISQELNTLDLDSLAKTAVVKISALIGARHASLFLYDPSGDELVLQEHTYAHTLTRRIVVRHYQNTIMGLALRDRRTIHIEDVDEFERRERVRLVRTFADRYATRSCLSVPLIAGGFVMGILNFTDKIDGTAFNEVDDLSVVEQLKAMVAVALHNCRLFTDMKNQARVDSLTGLVTNRVFHDALANEVHRAMRYGRPLSLLMLDLDRFKQINDTHGHPAGDQVLKQVAELIRNSIRRGDTAARYGGDEIAILLPETDLKGAVILAGRLTELVHGRPLTIPNLTLSVTTSTGVAAYTSPMNAADLVQAADKALYSAKQKGRNRFEIA